MRTTLLLLLVSFSTMAQTTFLTENFSGAVVPALPTGWSMTFVSGGFAPKGWLVTDTSEKFYNDNVPVLPAGNKYAVVTDWYWPYNTPATLKSPTVNLTAATHPYLSFDYYYMAGDNGVSVSHSEKAWINISTNGGASWSTIDTLPASGHKWSARYVNLPMAAGMANTVLQFVYTDGGAHMYGIALDNVTIFDAQAYDLAMTTVRPVDGDPVLDFFLPGGIARPGGVVLNHGTSPITSFTATYQVGSKPPVSQTFSSTVAPWGSFGFNFTNPDTVLTSGRFPVKVWVKATGDTAANNDSMTTAVYGVTHWPHKNVYFEEGTGTWCGYCVRGIVYMDSLWKRYDTGVSIVAVHSGNDPMDSENVMTTHHADMLGEIVDFGYPSMVTDRRIVEDVTMAITRYNSFKSNCGLADISISGFHTTAGSADVTATIRPVTDLLGDYRLELVVTEDEVHGGTTAYAQHNYYSYQDLNQPMKGAGFDFQDSAGTIPASSMYYKFVSRYTVPDLKISPNGVAGSLPATMTKGTAYSYTFAGVPLSPSWHADKLRFIVLLINDANGYVYNSTYEIKPEGTDVLASMEERVMLYPNPATNLLTLKTAAGTFTTYTITNAMGQTMAKGNLGGSVHSLDISDLPAGMFYVSVYGQDGAVTRRFVKL